MIKSWVACFKRPSKETRYGDSQVFIDTKNNICFIVDGGDGECALRLISYLKENNIKKVYLLLTHPHSDHGDGLRKIIKDSYFTVLCFYCYDPNSLKKGLSNNRGSNSVREDIDYLNRMISEAKDRDIEVKYLVHGDKVELGDIKFNVYREQPSKVEDDDTYGWSYVNDGSLCLYFPDLYYWTSGDGSERIWDFIKKLGLTVKFFKIPHHGNNCPQSQANGLKSHGANLCWYNDLEPNGVGTNDFTLYGARRCKEAGITVIDCIGSDINMTFAMGKATITKGSSSWNYTIPYNGGYLEGWVIDSNGWRYRYKDGTWAVGWALLKWSKGENWFYFDEHGYMVTGWQYLKWSKGWSWFYFDKTDGYMKTSWVYDDNNWYYLNPTNGYMQTGWLDYNGRKCYLEPVSGKNQGHAYRSVTVKIDGETWQFDDNCYGTKITNTTAFTKRTVIDISQFNNVTNWSAVKATGYPVIIRIGYRGSKTGAITYDPKYKEYRSACEKYGIEHGFYFFPCSITDAEAHEEALFIKNEVIKSGIAMPVYLDSEVVQRDKSGRSDNLSKEKRTRMLKIICDDLLKWDIPVGIYASRSWLYNNLDMSQFATDTNENTWVAEYGVDATKYTGIYVMWQYTSKGSVNGISGNVDMSYQYKPFHLVKTSVNQVIETSAPVKIEKSELEKVIEVAKSDLGYLEKALKYKNNKEILYDKTKGASDENTTKHWFEIKPEWQGQPWCCCFITWVFTKALGKERAKELLKHYPYVYCPTLAGLFTKYSTPQVGDIVIFWKNGAYAHTGLVIAVSGNTFTTIEGNTSGASSVVPNGGGVCQKTYNLRDVNAKFCRPAYSSTAITSDANKVVVSDDMHSVKWKGYVNIGRNTKLAVRLQPNISAKECSFSGLKQGTEVGVSHEQGDWYLIKYDGKFGYVQKQYISKTKISEVSNPDPVTDDIHTVKWTGVVNTNGGTLNVRTQPNSSANTCSFSPLRKGTEVGVCSQSGDWYLIKYNGKYGYVYSSYVKRK
jgi:GH25 family lysozyme M1 (1,4-beta-N-acetylmuramidase)/uncharacterized protein YraI